MPKPSAGPGRRTPPRGRGLVSRATLLGVLLVVLSGCSTDKIPAFGMPEPITHQGHPVMALWKGAWVAAWAVGILVWGLIGWCIIAYRKRGDTLPPQVHYNLPIEILYTIVPCVVIAILFYFTAVDETNENKLTKHPAMTVDVAGYQWAWQFSYTGGPANGLISHGRVGQYPVLTVPTGERIRFRLTSYDVVHAFWIPETDFKRDVVPGRTNLYDMTFEKTGQWRGYCTELCGVDHDRMLFTLKVVDPTSFRSWASTTVSAAQNGTGSDRYTFAGSTSNSAQSPGGQP